MKKAWLEKMQLLEDDSFASKDSVNMHLDSVKYKDLETLKGKKGPFINSKEVEVYLAGDDSPEDKNMQRIHH